MDHGTVTVLLIEDDEADVFYLRELLGEDNGYRIIETHSLVEAERLYPGSEVDAVLLDLTLHTLSGLETLRRALSFIHLHPIIVLTGLDDEVTALQALREGAQDYLVKGKIDRQLLERSIRYAIERKTTAVMREDVERIIRHDLKSPLVSVISYFSLLKDEPEISKEMRFYAAEVETLVHRLLSMINMSQDLYRIEMGTYELEKDAIPLENLLTTVIQSLSANAAEKEVLIQLENIGTPIVEGEEILLYTMFLNLVKNAVDASRNGQIVTINMPPGSKPNLIRIDISNSGTIDPTIYNRFFDKYATTRKRGLGLGTYTARLIAEMHGGELSLDTSVPDRVTVRVSLPSRSDTER